MNITSVLFEILYFTTHLNLDLLHFKCSAAIHGWWLLYCGFRIPKEDFSSKPRWPPLISWYLLTSNTDFKRHLCLNRLPGEPATWFALLVEWISGSAVKMHSHSQMSALFLPPSLSCSVSLSNAPPLHPPPCHQAASQTSQDLIVVNNTKSGCASPILGLGCSR